MLLLSEGKNLQIITILPETPDSALGHNVVLITEKAWSLVRLLA